MLPVTSSEHLWEVAFGLYGKRVVIHRREMVRNDFLCHFKTSGVVGNMPHTNMEFLNDLELCFFLLLQHLLPLAASRVFHNGGILGLTTVDMQN